MTATDHAAAHPEAMAPRYAFRLPRNRQLVIGAMPAVMGIINVTPDSFSDGGVHLDAQVAIDSALQMERDGALVIDIGGESTRPGSAAVSVQQEIERVVPVIEGIRRSSDIAISIDTRKSDVARAALQAGADIVNDVSALRYDRELAKVVARSGVPVVLMHMRGEPSNMQQFANYDDVILDVACELQAFVGEARNAGIAPEQILVDPGIGFAKTYEHNLQLLAEADVFVRIAPMLVGASRKAFIGQLTGQPGGVSRMAGSLAAVSAAVRAGAAIVRVHDVRATVDFVNVTAGIVAWERR